MFKAEHSKAVADLVKTYIEREDNTKYDAFNRLYNLFTKNYRADMAQFERTTLELDRWQVRALFEDVFMKVLFKTEGGAYTPDNFIKVLNTSLRNQMQQKTVRDLMRQRKRNEAAFGGKLLSLDKSYQDKKGDGSETTLDARDLAALPDVQVMAKLDNRQKTDTQKKALVGLLLKRTSEKARTYAETLADCDFNYRKAARKLDTHHTTVKRVVERIGVEYDSTKFGDIRDWLTPAQ
ncbi:MAG: hypothetical protein ACQEUT_18425 [Bacillota bacterium]